MRHNTATSKIFLTLLVFGVILWLGGSLVRMSTAYDIYVPFSQMELKADYSDTARLHTVKLFAMGALYTGIGFSSAFFGFVLLGFYLRKQLKQYGWLFMALVLFILSAPWGFYEMYLDIQLNFAIMDKGITFDSATINDLFVTRFSKLSFWPVLSYMAAITGVLTLVWRPLNKYTGKSEENLQVNSEGGNNETE
jgi:hypothetical protein